MATSFFEGFNRNVSIIALGRVLRSFYFGFVAFILPLYLKHIGFSVVQIGLYALVATVASSVLVLLSGFLGDLISRKKTYIAMSSLSFFLFLILLTTTDHAIVFLSSIFGMTFSAMGGGAGGGPVAPLMTAMVAESVERNRTNVYSRLTSLATIAAVAGAAFSSVVSSVVPDYYHLLFLVAMVLNAVSILFSLFLTERRDRVEKATRQDIIPRKSGRNILFISLSGAFGSVGLGMVIPLISLWFKMESLSTPEISVIFDISYIAAAVLVNFSPYFERRIGMINSVVLFRILGSVLLVFIPFLPAMGAAAIYILRTGFYQMALPIRQNFSMTVFAAEERSRGSSLTGLSRRLPYGFATTAGSVLLASGMYLALFLTAGTVSLLDPILYYLFFHGRERRGAVSDAAAAPQQ